MLVSTVLGPAERVSSGMLLLYQLEHDNVDCSRIAYEHMCTCIRPL